ncbi:MAG: tRNA pseudouridine(13) synthase TruD [Candidatus Altiarchaeota archaeon]
MSVNKPPALEESLGLEVYKSSTTGIGGRIKVECIDFIVEEVDLAGNVVEIKDLSPDVPSKRDGRFLHFTLVKTNWDTHRAIKEISSRLGISQRRLGFAGTKDKKAVSSQRVSAENVSVEDALKVSIKDLEIGGLCYQDNPIELGDLWGNHFTIVIREVDGSDIKQNINETESQLTGGFPNFFGLQRFGIQRPITHLVGKALIKGDVKQAVMIYLSATFGGEQVEEAEARNALADSGDFSEALKNFPRYLGYEKAMLNHLVKKPDDFSGAITQLPFNLQMMFVHAYQGWIFNRALSEYVRNDWTVERLPLVGFATPPDEVSAKILDSEGVTQGDFRLRNPRRLSSKGSVRDCWKPVLDFKLLEVTNDELNKGKEKATLSFKLEKGSYATTLIREYMKNEWWGKIPD